MGKSEQASGNTRSFEGEFHQDSFDHSPPDSVSLRLEAAIRAYARGVVPQCAYDQQRKAPCDRRDRRHRLAW
jgi:hypothetical protein